MSKKCARCEKTVYPTEELKCLDKIWHKPCFKCKECGMALNMRNYKGFNKEPYCEAHIPKAKATTMAETPELRRIAENTKLQSNVTYHADFEKSKGKFTQVADDPETLRIKQNTKIISNVAYHGELQRKAQMEQMRSINENGYKEGDVKNANMPNMPHSNVNMPPQAQAPPAMNMNQYQPPPPVQQSSQHHHQPQVQPQPAVHHHAPPQNVLVSSQPAMGNPNSIGKISDYDPQNSQFTSPYSNRTSQTLIYSSDVGTVNSAPSRHIGSVHDMDPVNHNYGSLGRVYRAMYDYEAQDDDEVSFADGDLIINVSRIDGGWMTGEVQRTGQVGMLPANYVQLASI